MNGPQGLGFRFGKIRRLSAPENMGIEKCPLQAAEQDRGRCIRCIPTIYILGVPCFGVPLNIHVKGTLPMYAIPNYRLSCGRSDGVK